MVQLRLLNRYVYIIIVIIARRSRTRSICTCNTYPRGRWELRERGDVPGGHMAGQLEPIPTDLLHADLLPLSYVKCGLHA